MALPTPIFTGARAVFELPALSPRTPDQDDIFIQSAKPEFPTLAARELVPPGLPPNIPYLALQSTAARLAVSSVGSEFETRFYGDFAGDRDKVLDYVARKSLATLHAWNSIDLTPSFFGVILNLGVSFKDEGSEGLPAQFMIEHQLRHTVDSTQLEDAMTRLGLRVGERFVTMTAASYVTRRVGRPVFPGQQILHVRHWEGEVDDYGIELSIDVNNKPELTAQKGDVAIDEGAVVSTIELVAKVIDQTPQYLEHATLDTGSLIAEKK